MHGGLIPLPMKSALAPLMLLASCYLSHSPSEDEGCAFRVPSALPEPRIVWFGGYEGIEPRACLVEAVDADGVRWGVECDFEQCTLLRDGVALCTSNVLDRANGCGNGVPGSQWVGLIDWTTADLSRVERR